MFSSLERGGVQGGPRRPPLPRCCTFFSHIRLKLTGTAFTKLTLTAALLFSLPTSFDFPPPRHDEKRNLNALPSASSLKPNFWPPGLPSTFLSCRLHFFHLFFPARVKSAQLAAFPSLLAGRRCEIIFRVKARL